MKRRQKTAWLATVLTVFAVSYAGAQSNEIIDRYLERQEADMETSIYLAMIAGGHSDGSVSVESALQEYDRQFTRPKMKEGVLTVGDFSLITIQALDIPPGVMNRLFNSPRYSTRDLKSYRIVRASVSQFDTISGEAALSLLGNAIAWKETH